MRNLLTVLLTVCVTLLIVLSGCGSTGRDNVVPGGSSPVKFSIIWPDRARAVTPPASALSCHIALYATEAAYPTSPTTAWTIERQDSRLGYTQPWTSPQAVPVGRWYLVLTFYSEHALAGSVVAASRQWFSLNADGTGADSVTLEQKVSQVSVVHATVPVGHLQPLDALVRDADNNLIAVTPGSIYWTVSSGSSFLRFTRNDAEGLSPGVAKVIAHVDGISSTPTDITVTVDYTSGDYRYVKTMTENFVNPTGICLDGFGNLYVNDGALVYKFDKNGNRTGLFSPPGITDPLAFQSYGIAVGTDGTIYVVDVTNAQLRRYSAEGSYLGAWAVTGSTAETPPCGVTVNSQNKVYIPIYSEGLVTVLSHAGVSLFNWHLPSSGSQALPLGIAIGPDDSVYVSDYLANTIVKYTATGTFVKRWMAYGNSGDYGIWGMAVDVVGNLFVAQTGSYNRIHKYSAAGEFIAVFGNSGPEAEKLSASRAVAVDTDGRVYVLDAYKLGIVVYELQQ